MATNYVSLSWGKPTITIDDTEIPTPVEDSTELTVETGDKTEATIEGGEVEAVRYKAATYSLTFKVRRAKGRTFPLPIAKGRCEGEHKIVLKPEIAGTPGFTISRGVLVVNETYTPADGAMWEVTVDALYPTDGVTEAVEWAETEETAAASETSLY